jgi:hypothetical protein
MSMTPYDLPLGWFWMNLGMNSEEGTSSIATQVINITDRARGMARQALHLDMQWLFVIACSHYENFDLQAMSQGFVLGYDDAELDQIEEEVAPLAKVLAVRKRKLFPRSS